MSPRSSDVTGDQYVQADQFNNLRFDILNHASRHEESGADQIQIMPAGAIVSYGGSTAPTGWLLCDGSAVSRTTYSKLFSIIGTTFGSGDGSTTFTLPDLRGRFPLGVDGTAGRISSNDALGNSGGSESHDHPSTTSSGPSATTGAGSMGSAVFFGSSTHTHDTDLAALTALPPYLVVQYIIKF